MNTRCFLLLWAVTGLGAVCFEAAAQSAPPSFYSGVVPGSPPKYWMESVTHEDLSSSRLLVFQTIPGVSYRVESSRDLLSWETVSTHDGLGQQEVVPMVQIKPPPIPQPNPIPQPAGTNVWMMLQKATTGGIVIYWISPEYTEGRRLFQSHHYPDLTLDPAWDESFVYVRKFGDYSFLVSHPRSVSIAPPNSNHGEEDLEMLAVFEQNFATINAEVRDHVEGVRFNPAPAPPPDPNGRKFFRVWADWGEDSDGDTVPDWEEFAMMNGVAGVGEDGALQAGGTPTTTANPTSGDANGNGVPDNEELDFDEDGIPRSNDADPEDKAIAWTKTRPTRYALFDVPLEYYDTGDPKWPVDVNSQGMVLFRDGVDWGGEFHELIDPDDGVAIQGMAINDHGTILGTATYDLSIENGHKTGTSIWKTPTSKPELVESGNIAASWPKNQDGFVSSFSNDGSFMSYASQITPSDYLGDYYWTTDANGDYQGSPADGYWYCGDAGVKWGWSGANQIIDAPSGGGDLGPTAFDKFAMVGGVVPALTSNRGSKARFFTENSWRSSATLSDVLDISASGIAHLWKNPDKKLMKTIPEGEAIQEGMGFWMNGRFLNLKTLVPGLPQNYLTASQLTVPGMADKGTFVLQMDSGSPQAPSACAMCLPCAVEEQVSDSVRLAYRDGEQDTVPYTGVDDVSITAEKTDPSANNKIWIMAPIGSGSGVNDVKIHIPATTTNPLTLSAGNLEGEYTVDQDDGEALALKGTGAGSADAGLTLMTGQQAAQNSPIGIKAMKRRQVRVTVTPIGRPAIVNGQTTTLFPDFLPTKEKLAKYLNKVYLLQTNAEIVLKYADPVALNFSLMTPEDLNLDPNIPIDPRVNENLPVVGGGALDVTGGAERSKEEDAFIPVRDPGADINVYYVGGISTIRGWIVRDESPNGYRTWTVLGANGYADVNAREAWVSDFRMDAAVPLDGIEKEVEQYAILQCNTIAHEIGHIIVGGGHPDTKSASGKGPAPLEGTNHIERLMVSGGVGNNRQIPGVRLVKGEWDKAEAWLQGCPYPPIQPTPPNP